MELGGRTMYAKDKAANAEGIVEPGTVLFEDTIRPDKIGSKKDMHSIQVGENEHWDSVESAICFCAHSGQPNCYFDLSPDKTKIRIVARAQFKVSEPMSVNYNTFELGPMTCPFVDVTTGWLTKGFNYIGTEERAFLRAESHILFPHVKARVGDAPAEWIFKPKRRWAILKQV